MSPPALICVVPWSEFPVVHSYPPVCSAMVGVAHRPLLPSLPTQHLREKRHELTNFDAVWVAWQPCSLGESVAWLLGWMWVELGLKPISGSRSWVGGEKSDTNLRLEATHDGFVQLVHNQPTNQPTHPPSHPPTNQPTIQLAHSPTNQPTRPLTHQPTKPTKYSKNQPPKHQPLASGYVRLPLSWVDTDLRLEANHDDRVQLVHNRLPESTNSVRMRISIYLSIYLSIYPSIYQSIYIYLYIYLSIYVYPYTYMHIYIYRHIYIYIYIYIYVYTYIHI